MKSNFLILIFILLFLPEALNAQSYHGSYRSKKLLLLYNRNAPVETTYAGGAKGDGVTDDFLALQTYINNNSTLDLTAAVGKTFLISQPLYPKNNSTWNLGTATIKMMDGDSSMLTADYHKDMNYCVVAEPNKFAVGQWVGIVDDEFDEGDYLRAQGQDYDALQRLEELDRDRTPFEIESLFSSGNLLRYGWTDSIIRISNDTLFFAHTLNYADTISVVYDGRVGHVQSVIICDSIDNFTINGGIIDANGFSTNQIMVHPVCTFPNNNEQVAAGVGIAIMGSSNIVFNNVTSINGVTHNLIVSSWQNAGAIGSENIALNNITLNKARMKNFWGKEIDGLTINVMYCDSAIREDGIILYSNVEDVDIDSAFVTNFRRNGIATNGWGTGGIMDDISITNSAIGDAFDNTWSVGLALKGTNQSVNKIALSGANLVISNQYGTPTKTNNINVSDVSITDCPAKGNYSTAPSGVVDIKGNVGRVNFNNLVLNNNNGRAIVIDTAVFYPPSSLIYNGFPDSIYFDGGGVYNQTGYTFEYIPDALRDSTLIEFTNFCTSSLVIAGTPRMDANRNGAVDLTWTDSSASAKYYVYKNGVLRDSTANKTYTDSGLTAATYEYKVKGRDNFYNYSAFSNTTSQVVPSYPLDIPTSIAATSDTISISLSWTDPSSEGLDSIYVYSAGTNDTTAATKIASVDAGVQSYNNTSLSDGDVKFYWLKTKDIYGNTTSLSSVVYSIVLTATNTKLWLEMDEEVSKTASGDSVETWGDKTANGFDLVQATAGKKPIWSSNGILFDGANDFMKKAFTVTQPTIYYLVVKQVSWTISDVIFDGNTDWKQTLLQSATTPGIKGYAGSIGGQIDELTTGSFGLVTVYFSTTNSFIKVNNNDATTFSAGAGNTNGLCIGSQGSGTSAWSNIQVKAVIMRSVSDNTTIQTNIRNYLNAKHSIY